MKIKLALGILAGCIASANANLIVNGSFEDNGTNIDQSNSGWVLYNPINGWTSTGDVEVQNSGKLCSGCNAYAGTHYAELDADNNNPGSVAIMQTITTQVGSVYKLSFAFGGRPEIGQHQNTLDFGINGVMTRLTKPSTDNTLNWTMYSYSFVGTGSDVIYFADGGIATPDLDNTFGTLLDNVSVEAAAVPEPTTLGLFGMGLLALIGFARVRATRKA